MAGTMWADPNSFNYWIIKPDAAGNLEWEKSYGNINIERANSIQQTTDGGYIIAGYSSFNNCEGDCYGNNGGSDYWVIKLDEVGNL